MVFLLLVFAQASLAQPKNKNPSPLRGKGFFLVDKKFEISNLLHDITTVIKLSNTLFGDIRLD
jgi:hypothetical protein